MIIECKDIGVPNIGRKWRKNIIRSIIENAQYVEERAKDYIYTTRHMIE